MGCPGKLAAESVELVNHRADTLVAVDSFARKTLFFFKIRVEPGAWGLY